MVENARYSEQESKKPLQGEAVNTLTETIIKNSWQHGEYSWFPEENTNNNNST